MFRFRSLLSRIAVAAVLVLALALSAVPAQAQPRALGSAVLNASWLDAALTWLQSMLDDGPELLLPAKTKSDPNDPNDPTLKSGPCIDPMGCPGFTRS